MQIFKLFGSIFIDDQEALNSLDNVDKNAKKTESGLSKTFETIGKVGGVIATVVGSAAVVLGGIGLDSVKEYQKSINSLNASTGATTYGLEGLEDIVKNIYADNFGESFQDIADTVGIITKTIKGSKEEIQGAAEKAIILRDTFGYDVKDSVRAVDQLMKQFGITSEQAYNLIAQGNQRGLDFSGEMLDSITEYSVQFKKAGMDAEDMFNILLSGTQDGAFNLDKVGDAVKEFNIRLVDGSKTTAEGLSLLGFNANDVAKNMAAGGDKAQKQYFAITEALANMNDKQKQNLVGTDLFGTMWEDLGPKVVGSLQNMNDSFNRTIDSLGDINKVKYNDLGSALEGIKRQAITNVFIPFGQQILPVVNEFANYFITDLIPALNNFSSWIIANMPTVQLVVVTVFSIFSSAIQMVIDNSNWLIPVLGGVVIALLALNIVNTINELYKLWQATTFATTLAQEGLNAALLANPIGIVIIAIGAFVAILLLLWNNCEGFRNGVISLFTTITTMFSTVLQGYIIPFLQNVVVPFFQDVFSIIGNAIEAGFAVLQWAWNFILQPIFSLILWYVQTVLIPQWQIAFSVFSSIISVAFSAINGLWNNSLKPILNGILNFITGVFTGNWSRAWEGIKSIFSGVWEGMKTLAKAPLNFIIGGINGFIRGINRIKIPDWVPDVGGLGINIPTIPMLAKGGTVVDGDAIVGEAGAELLKVRNGRTSVIPLTSQERKYGTAGGNEDGKSNEDSKSILLAILEVLQVIASNPTTFNVDGETLATTINPFSDKISGKNLKLTERGLRV